MRRASLVVLILGAVAVSAPAQKASATRVVSGTTVDSLHRPVPYVTFWLDGEQRGISDDTGGFHFSVSPSALTLDVKRIGYRPTSIALRPGGDTALSVALATVPTRLGGVRVTTEVVQSLKLSGFHDRLADRQKWGGSAQFVTPEEIEFRKPAHTSQLFDGRTSVRVRRVGNCSVIVRCWALLGTNNCGMAVYLDGHRLVPEGGFKLSSRSVEGNIIYIDDVTSPGEIAAIEIYQRATNAPPQYQSLNGSCGVALIWTK